MPATTAAIEHHAFLVVGCGPVGAVTALLLAASRRSVLVLEAATAVYPLPRAVHIDAHSARILATLLPASICATLLSPMQHCTFTTGRGRQLLRFTSRIHLTHELHSDFIIDQPALERALRSRFAFHPNLSFKQGETVTGVEERNNNTQRSVFVTAASGAKYSADFVLACDGARSTVRSLLNIPMLSLASASAFTATQWWVIDGRMSKSMKRQYGFTELGVTQVCDAVRPLTVVNLPGDRIRVEVRRQGVDGVVGERLLIASGGWWARLWASVCYLFLVAWSAVAPLISSSWSAWRVRPVAVQYRPKRPVKSDYSCPPPLSTLLPRCIPTSALTATRCVPYSMHSLLAASFMSRSRRIILLGDAAHLTPPYLGQALCLGIRDAASLAFRIAQSSPSHSSTSALDEWEAERRAEATEVTTRSGKVGQLLEVRGAWQCRLRDAVMRAIDCSEWMKAAFQAEVAVYGRVLYAAGRQRLFVWPQMGDSDAALLHCTAVSIIGVDCDARQLSGLGGRTHPHHAVAQSLHWARLDTRSHVHGRRWREWLTSVGLRGAGVAVVRPDRYVLGIYASLRQQRCARYLHSVDCCTRAPTIHCDDSLLPVIDDLVRLLSIG